MIDTFRKYAMVGIVIEAIASGIYRSMSEFKRLNCNKISERERNIFQITCVMSMNLGVFSLCITKIAWWAFAKKGQIKDVKLLYSLKTNV